MKLNASMRQYITLLDELCAPDCSADSAEELTTQMDTLWWSLSGEEQSTLNFLLSQRQESEVET